MNIEDIQSRLRELNSQKYLSDEEYHEKEELLESLAILRNEQRKSDHKKDEKKQQQEMLKSIPREHTIVGKAISKGLKAVVEHFKEKPVTIEELQALKLKAMKERLKADIAKSKKVQRDSKGDIFGSSKTTSRKSGKRSSRGDSFDDVSSILRGSIGSSKNVSFYSQKSDKDIRKILGI